MNGGDDEVLDPSPPLELRFSQVFGERSACEEVHEVDVISAIQFDNSGDHLATGDRGGRVVLFERTDAKNSSGARKDLEETDYPLRHPEFRYKTEFQSHDPEVQDKKIKKICDVSADPSSTAGNVNGEVPEANSLFPPGGIPSLRLPVVTSHESSPVARCRRVYSHAHDYHINSISNNSDGETFISADDLRINLWNLEINNQSFNIVDVKPEKMEDLSEVITSAEFHPTHCNMLAYSSSKGSIRLIDLRQSALCDSHSKLFEDREAAGPKSFFTEIIASVSDIKFAKEGRYLLSRDYMTLKLWDINMDSGPVSTFQVHEHLKPKLCDLYENDSIFDKFECCISGDGLRAATGSYSNMFRVFGVSSGSTETATLEASRNPMRRHVPVPSSPFKALSRVVSRGSESPGVDGNSNALDYTTKLLHLAWHPKASLVACAAGNSLYMYYA
ncbi:hypothetical protein Bca4012_064692 [Brassica carinata]